MQQVPTPLRPPIQEHDRDDESQALAARKQFWSKFKRPAPSTGEDASGLLKAPTLTLGGDDVGEVGLGSKTTEPGPVASTAPASVSGVAAAKACPEPVVACVKGPVAPAPEPTVEAMVPAAEAQSRPPQMVATAPEPAVARAPAKAATVVAPVPAPPPGPMVAKAPSAPPTVVATLPEPMVAPAPAKAASAPPTVVATPLVAPAPAKAASAPPTVVATPPEPMVAPAPAKAAPAPPTVVAIAPEPMVAPAPAEAASPAPLVTAAAKAVSWAPVLTVMAAEPSGSQLALEVAPATASQEAGIQAQVDAIRSRVMKMDNVEIATAYEQAANHPRFQKFTEEEGINPVQFGSIDEIEELVHFHSWLIEDGSPPDLHKSLVDVAAAGGVPAKKENEPIESEVQATQAALVPPQPSARNPVDSTVETALKRLQTVDLQDGQRPPQFLASMGNVEVPCQTLVWMMVGGVKAPVPLPLSPEQCASAGLELVNPPQQQQGDQHSTVATAPGTTESTGEARQAEGEGNAMHLLNPRRLGTC